MKCSVLGYSKNKTYTIVMMALLAAVYCIISPMVIPIGPVPISFTNLLLYLSLYLVGGRMTVISYVVYILMGLVGLPVFSGYSGGIGKLLGPTGGYIIGFLPMAMIAGMIVDRYSSSMIRFWGILGATLIAYILETIWFCVVMDTVFVAALGICVFPFIPGDIVKIVIAVVIGPVLRDRLKKEGLYKFSQYR